MTDKTQAGVGGFEGNFKRDFRGEVGGDPYPVKARLIKIDFK